MLPNGVQIVVRPTLALCCERMSFQPLAGQRLRLRSFSASPVSISRQHLYDILRERKPVSPAVAVRLGKLFGEGAGVWVRMQAAYDTWNAEREEDVSKIPTLRANAA